MGVRRKTNDEYIALIESRRSIDKNGCWNYTGFIGPRGYGEISLHGKTRTVSRIYWLLTQNPSITSTVLICHHCDNRLCFNPAHLYEGSYKSNVDDMYRRNRRTTGGAFPGEAHHKAKLKSADIPKIRKRIKAGEGTLAISKDYGVSQSAITLIKTGKTWKHV